MYLETERLILREAMPEDVDEYAAIRNSQFVQQFNVFTDRSREQILKDFTDGSGEGDALIMQHKESNAVVGAIFIGEDSIRYGVASKELSYFLGEAYSCKGYMKEALSAVIDSNVTTAIAALVLVFIGKGMVKGFGITLFIGVVVSVLTAFFLSKAFIRLFIGMGFVKPSLYCPKAKGGNQ